MELRGRLKLISDKIPASDTICDVGTDHAYLPVFLIKRGICRYALACDIKKGPLIAARRNIHKYMLEEYIETRLGPGLEPLKEGEADVIIIAGMGGILISEILNNDVAKAKSGVLILQPMNSPEILRDWLFKNGFDIFDEELVQEGEKLYNVICARWDGLSRKIEDIYTYIGLKLISNNDPLLKKFILRKIMAFDKIINGLEKTGPCNAVEKLDTYKQLKIEAQKILVSMGG